MRWPSTPEDLEREQERLASLPFEPWSPPEGPLRVAACAVVFGRAGRDGVGWAAAVVDVPTVGVTDDPLLATGGGPAREWMWNAPLRIGREVVAYRVRTRAGAKPVVAHAAWRTSAEVAADVVLGSCALARWPEALREARRLARELRALRS